MRYVMPCRETDWAGGSCICSCFWLHDVRVCVCVLVLVLVLVFPVYGALECLSMFLAGADKTVQVKT